MVKQEYEKELLEYLLNMEETEISHDGFVSLATKQNISKENYKEYLESIKNAMSDFRNTQDPFAMPNSMEELEATYGIREKRITYFQDENRMKENISRIFKDKMGVSEDSELDEIIKMDLNNFESGFNL